MLSLASVVQTQASTLERDSLLTREVIEDVTLMTPLKPTYLASVSSGGGWGSNWFVNVQGGASAFIGSPLGCADLFDRTMPVLQVSLGKWFTPAVGGRISYQGMKFKDSQLETRGYKFVHADFMYNLTHAVRVNDNGLSRWDVIPFVGIGMIHNEDFVSTCSCTKMYGDTHPFAFTYGVQGRYRLTDRLHLTAELSGMTTFKSFDAIGKSNRFGDNMLNLSAGLSVTLGKTGWKRVIDAKPYMTQNDWLIEHSNRLVEHNRYLSKQHVEDTRIIAEYHKILEIEGLLDIYGDTFNQNGKKETKRLYPKNDYSGLNSLRARINNKGWDGNTENMPKAMKKRGDNYDKESEKALNEFYNDTDETEWSAYLSAMKDGKECIGAPIYFFFNLGTDVLTETNQLLNIDEIVKVAKKYNLHVRITGAADSATGTEAINDSLSTKRADYIKRLMIDRGIGSEYISTHSEGGIDDFSPIDANRNSCVILTF